MSTIGQVRDAVKATIDAANISGLTVYAQVAESIKVPAVIIEPDKQHQSDFGGGGTLSLDLIVVVQRVDGPRGQIELDDYITLRGDKSIPQVIRDNNNLGLTDAVTACSGFENYGAKFTIGGIDYIGAVLKTTVYT